MENKRMALPKGTKIEYSGMLAEVVEDFGGDKLTVNCEGDVVIWRWSLDGEDCRVVGA